MMVAPLVTRRAAFLGSLGLVLSPLIAVADTSRPWRVALVTSGRSTLILSWLRDAFRERGYEEGKNLIIDVREAGGHYDALPNLVAELLAQKPDVIIAEATPAVAVAQHATSVIPIVMAPATDPVGSGFIKTFAQPGGNITGVANMFGELTKTLDIVRLVFPSVKKIGLLGSHNATHPAMAKLAKQGAAAIGVAAELFTAADPEDLDKTFADMKAASCEVVYVLADPPRPALPQIALRYRLPTVYQVSTYPDLGGLMSYGPDLQALLSRAADYTIRILDGQKPSEMPVEQPTKFVFVVNLRTAKPLGVTIPEQVLLMADKVIE
ncbi:ABC transporter substrate-binding protein [Bradyrhizobium sp. Tv2a-2]|uniref:ABC transporter substrate-binding protein n=1 Tax=Bradyrhizobium sp. Tv2a-2 TaxID=113395 RepID=UPI0018DD4080|nr:ABC transporter substrate-binding protein [Bradyrhizobium sp. Tv2a-2]